MFTANSSRSFPKRPRSLVDRAPKVGVLSTSVDCFVGSLNQQEPKASVRPVSDASCEIEKPLHLKLHDLLPLLAQALDAERD